jgi:hypothetical protein
MGQTALGVAAPKAQPKPQMNAKLKQKPIKFAPKPNEIPRGERVGFRAENQTTYSAHP